MYNQTQAPIIILNMNTKREHGRSAQLSNIKAGKVNYNKIKASPSLI